MITKATKEIQTVATTTVFRCDLCEMEFEYISKAKDHVVDCHANVTYLNGFMFFRSHEDAKTFADVKDMELTWDGPGWYGSMDDGVDCCGGSTYSVFPISEIRDQHIRDIAHARERLTAMDSLPNIIDG